MKNVLAALLMSYLSIGSLSAQGYHISGSQIYDANNTAVVFKGTNVNGANWVWPRETTQDAALILSDWKFNIVRVNCFLYGSNYTANNNYDNIVNTFTSMGAIVILEIHDFTGTEPSDAQLIDLKNFWIDKANRYKGNSSVWFNIENEPVDGWNGSVTLTTRWRDVHDGVIGAIRGAGANNICICDDNGWGSGGWQASSSGILTYGSYLTGKYSNVAFGLHFYDDSHTQTEYTNWINSIVAKGLCPIVGEFGIDGGGPSPLTPGLVLTALNSSNQLKMVTRLSWAWAGGDNNDYCSSGGDGTGGGYNINKTDGTKPTNLSAFGSLIWDDSHTTPGSNVSVTGVSVSPTSISLAVGASSQLTATVSPANATNNSVNWSSSKTGVATVNASGLVTAVAAGSCTITATTSDGGKTASCAVTVTSASSGSNLALNKVTTVSSTESSSLAGSYAVDGNSSSRWSSAYSDPQWISVDLGATYTINEVKLNWEVAAGKDYKIQVSSDASTWTDIKTVTGNTTAGVKDYTGLSGSGRYVRMYGTARATTYGYSLYEMEVYGTLVTWTKIDDANASVVYSAGWGTYTGNGGYQNTEHYTFGSGNSATLTFTGTKARFYGFKRNDLSFADIYVDGTKVASVDCYNSTMLVNQMLYETAALTIGQHTIAVKCTSTKNASSSSTQLIVDAFEYTASASASVATNIANGKNSVASGERSGLSVDVFPNPVTDKSVLKINASEVSDVNIQLMDISGRIVFDHTSHISGENSLPMNLGGLGKGVYILHVRQGNHSVTKLILK